jgi:hypothetical protein
MTKKTKPPVNEEESLRGFEEFIAEQTEISKTQRSGIVTSRKNDSEFEHLTFITTDAERLIKLKTLLKEKIPFMSNFDQSDHLIKQQITLRQELKSSIFNILNDEKSSFQKSLSEVFDSYFDQKK